MSHDLLLQMVADGAITLSDNPKNFIVHEVWISYPDEPGGEPSHGHTVHESAKERVTLSSARVYNAEVLHSNVEFQTLEQYKVFCQEYHEIDCGSNAFYTEVEYEVYLAKKKAKEARELRQQMEAKCKEIMAKYSIEQVDSFEFFEKLDELADEEDGKYESKLTGLQEDGLCIGFGATVDQWCEEKNHWSGRREAARISWHKLRNYLNETYPILAAAYREKRLASVTF